MKIFRVINLTKRTVIADKVEVADSPVSRLRGLLGRAGLNPKAGLILKPCSSVHTFFMRFPIDVAFVDNQNRIIRIYSQLKPWRLSALFLKASFCLELPPGLLSATQTQEGDQIQII